jgi:hypothetical protein
MFMLVKQNPNVPVVPVFIHGLGKTLPKGTWILVPFICDIFVGEPVAWPGDTRQFMASLRKSVDDLAAIGHFPAWD